MSGADDVLAVEAIAEILTQTGTRHVFGLAGDDTIRLVAAVQRRGVEFVSARHENAAVAMAVGYAHGNSSLGVCILSRGPGLTNAMTGLVNAVRGGANVLTIVGDTATEREPNTTAGPETKSLDLKAFSAASGMPLFRPKRAEVVTTVCAALSAATHHRPSLLAIPEDLWSGPVGNVDEEPSVAIARRPIRSPRDGAVDAAASLLLRSRRPLFVAGLGAWNSGAADEIVRLAEQTGGVLATTLRAVGLFDGHPRNLGIIGGLNDSLDQDELREIDCVVAIGASLNARTTHGQACFENAAIIHIDADRASAGRYFWADIAVIGDARVSCDAILRRYVAVSPEPKPAEADGMQYRVPHPASRTQTQAPSRLAPGDVVGDLDRHLPANRVVVTDTGNFLGFVPEYVKLTSPDQFFLGSYFSSIGLGLGTAIGLALARPDRRTVLFVGDGALMMSLGELETVARLGPALTVIVMNDAAFGAERHMLRFAGLETDQADFPDQDFAAIASSLGIPAITLETLTDIDGSSEEISRVDGPLVIDCKLDRDVAAHYLQI